MKACAREAEVVEAVLRRGTPGAELAAHLDECLACHEAATIASLLRADRDWTRTDVPVPAAGQVWWRAAVRARVEATEAAARPLTWARGAAAAAAAGLLAATGGTLWGRLEGVLSVVERRVLSLVPGAPQLPDLLAVGVTGGMLYALVAGFVVLTPLVLYFALADE